MRDEPQPSSRPSSAASAERDDGQRARAPSAGSCGLVSGTLSGRVGVGGRVVGVVIGSASRLAAADDPAGRGS